MLKFQWFECRKMLKKVGKYGKIEISIKMQKTLEFLRSKVYIYQVYNGNPNTEITISD